jgi:competence protein ComEC
MINKQNPLMIPSALFVLGLVFGYCFEIPQINITVLFLLISATTFLAKQDLAKSTLLYGLFLVLGCLLISFERLNENPRHFSNISCEEINILVNKREQTKRGFRYFAGVKSCFSSQEKVCKGRLLIYTDSTVHLQLFNTYRLPAHYKRIETFKNPDRFDYGNYLSNKNVYHSIYLKRKPRQISECNLILKLVRTSKMMASEFFRENIKQDGSAKIINAILIGEKSELDKNVKDLFVNNGLAHLLAISGMHVGIILLIINFFIFKIQSPLLKNTIVLTGIWFYILLTGLQVPAIRAGFMFTVYILGQLINRNTKGLNSIFFAALVLLSIQPKLILQLSFQLSFAAMISILLFYGPIRNLLEIKNRIASSIWNLVALNISVQILVLPLSILYFQQIPTYSIVASLISVPFILITMWASTLALVFANFDPIANVLCRILEVTLDYYIQLLHFISNLPKALIINVDIGVPQIVTWTLGCFIILHTFQTRLSILRASLLGFAPVLIVSSFLKIQNNSIHTITVYDDNKQVIIDHISDHDTVRYKEFPELYSYPVESNSTEVMKVHQMNTHFKIGGRTVMLIDEQSVPTITKAIDLCIIKTTNLIDTIAHQCKHIIIPRNIQQSHVYQNQYNIKDKGAFVLNLKRK